MKNPISQLNFFFISSITVILIWMMSTSVKGYVRTDLNAFPLQEYEAHYAVTWLGVYAGKSVHKLHRQTNGHYHYEAKTEPHMRILPYHYVESSDFAWQNGQIVPQNYFYNIQEGAKRKKGNVSFDWKSNKIRNTHIKQPWEAALTLGTQDKLTQTLCLRQALLNKSPSLEFMVAEQDKLKNYTFIVLGNERLQTKLGLLDTIKVEHISRKGHRTTMWFAKKYEYLPVKMTQSRKGKQVANGEIVSFTPILAPV
ncbi:MAG: DUF3108 domain-containing protein [Proteobacteria bacterium]|nr:DUF3108 domain-containing protein [Pseudomonadota bacterium]